MSYDGRTWRKMLCNDFSFRLLEWSLSKKNYGCPLFLSRFYLLPLYKFDLHLIASPPGL